MENYKKLENYKLKKYIKTLKAYIKMEKNIKFGDTEIQKQNFTSMKDLLR